MRNNPTEQQIYSHRFTTEIANQLRAEGASDTKQLLIKNSSKSYCVLYRIEDKEEYVESMLRKKAPEIYKVLLHLRFLLKGSTVKPDDMSLAEALIETIEAPYEARFMLSQDDPGVVYSPGDEHKLEYNLAWVCGVAQANKTARLLSIPTRKSFLRRNGSGNMSAFAYELGVLYRVGYRPSLSKKNRVYMKPPVNSNVSSSKKAVVPNLKNMMDALSELHRIMFPEMVRLGHEVSITFTRMMLATTRKKLKHYNKQINQAIDTLRQVALSSKKVGKFKVANVEEYQDIMLSACIDSMVNTSDETLRLKLESASLVKADDAPRNALYSLSVVSTSLIKVRKEIYKETEKSLSSQRKLSITKKRKQSQFFQEHDQSPTFFSKSSKKQRLKQRKYKMDQPAEKKAPTSLELGS